MAPQIRLDIATVISEAIFGRKMHIMANARLVLLFATLLPHVVAAAPAAPARHAPSQEEVFRSIQDNVGGTDVDAAKLAPIFIAAAGLVLLLIVAGQRKKPRAVRPKALNHHGKLMREVLKTVPLRGKEVKQLKAMGDHADADQPLASPLTLLLCPSLMAKTIQGKRFKVDRRALASVARKAGLQVTRR